MEGYFLGKHYLSLIKRNWIQIPQKQREELLNYFKIRVQVLRGRSQAQPHISAAALREGSAGTLQREAGRSPQRL